MLTLKLEGLDKLQAQLVELGVQLGVKTLAKAARKAFLPVLTDARSLVPVDSGALRDALKVSVKKPKGGEAVVVVGILVGAGRAAQARVAAAAFGEAQSKALPPARRWHFIELGTSHTAAHPFLRPALDRNASVVLAALKEEIAKGIEQAIRRKAGS